MALSKDDILNAIAEMTVMDVVDLIKAMEDKFGVTAAAAVAAAPVAAAAPAGLRDQLVKHLRPDPVIALGHQGLQSQAQR